MDSLSNFLERFKNLLAASKNSKETIRSVIASVASITLKDEEIDVREGTVHAKTSPMARSTIFMHKKKILEELQKQLGPKAPKDLR